MITMATRADLMQRLAAIPAEDLLTLLEDDAIYNLAARYFHASAPSQSETSDTPSPIEPIIGDAPKDKAKRPLNAFMAFRSMAPFPLTTRRKY